MKTRNLFLIAAALVLAMTGLAAADHGSNDGTTTDANASPDAPDDGATDAPAPDHAAEAPDAGDAPDANETSDANATPEADAAAASDAPASTVPDANATNATPDAIDVHVADAGAPHEDARFSVMLERILLRLDRLEALIAKLQAGAA